MQFNKKKEKGIDFSKGSQVYMSGKSMYVCMYVCCSAFWGCLPYCNCFILYMLVLLHSLFGETCSLSGEMHFFVTKIKGLKLVSHQLLNTGQIMNWILNFFSELGVEVIVFRKMGGYFLAYVVTLIVNYSKGICV